MAAVASALWSARLAVDSKTYFVDVRENARGVYLKLTEVGVSKRRSTVLLPRSVLCVLRELLAQGIMGHFDAAAAKADHGAAAATGTAHSQWGVSLASRYAEVGYKKYYVDVVQTMDAMQTQRRFLKVSEVQAPRGRTTVVIDECGWLQLKRALDEMQVEVPSMGPEEGEEASLSVVAQPTGASPSVSAQLPVPVQASPLAQAADAPAALAGVAEVAEVEDASVALEGVGMQTSASATAAATTTATPTATPTAATEAAVGAKTPQPHPSAPPGRRSTLTSVMLRADGKLLYLDLLSSPHGGASGRCVKIAQLNKGYREVVLLPRELWSRLPALVGAFALGDLDPAVPGLERMLSSRDAARTAGAAGVVARGPAVTLCGRSHKAGSGKLFFTDWMENDKGRFLKISEVVQHHNRTAICVPEVCLAAFKQALVDFETFQPEA